MQKLRIHHLGSGATTEVDFVGFNPAGKGRLLLVRYGLTGVHEFQLSSGQGTHDVANWALTDLDDVRQYAAERGIDCGIKREPVPVHKRGAKPKRKSKRAAVIELPRQPSLFGGE